MIHYKIMAPVQKKGLRALQIWCSQVTAEYDNVHINDLSNSFRDGLAFNAIIHHFRPDLFDYKVLKAADIRENNAHAFRVAETELGIPALLDPEDMVDCEEPDKFSVSTYLAQLYHLFKNSSSPSDSPAASPASRTSLARLSSTESESNDSLLSSSSSVDSSPPSLRSQPPQPLFNRADLIAKYGEDIFSCSSPPQTDKLQQVPSSPNIVRRPPSTRSTNTMSTPPPAKFAPLKTVVTMSTPVAKTAFDTSSRSPPTPSSTASSPSSATKKNESSSAVASVRKQFEAFAKISAS